MTYNMTNEALEAFERSCTVENGVLTECKDKTVPSLFVPDEVTGIAKSALFGCTELKEISLPCVTLPVAEAFCDPDSKKFDFECNIEYAEVRGGELCEGAFALINTLKHVRIFCGAVSVPKRAFALCTRLESIELPDSITSVGYEAFAACESITEIILPSAISELDEGVFNACANLQKVILPEGISVIPRGTFHGCRALESISIPASVTRVAEYAFRDTFKLRAIRFNGAVIIENNSFYSESISNLSLSDKVTSINTDGFLHCDKLERITVDAENPTYRSENNCLIEKASNTLLLASVGSEIPCGIVAIGKYAFSHRSRCPSIKFPDTLRSIGNGAFLASELTELVIPDGTVHIGENAFGLSLMLKTVKIPKSVKKIGNCAFGECNGLEEVTIPRRFVFRMRKIFLNYLSAIYNSKKATKNKPKINYT